MNEETKLPYTLKKCIHPRVKEVSEEFAPPSPMTVPRDSSQPKVGYITSIHKEKLVPVLVAQPPSTDKPTIILKLESSSLRRRK